MMDVTPKYHDAAVEAELIGENAFAIFAAVRKALEKAGAPAGEFDAYLNQAMSGNYDNVLQTTARLVGFKH